MKCAPWYASIENLEAVVEWLIESNTFHREEIGEFLGAPSEFLFLWEEFQSQKDTGSQIE